MKKIKLEKFNNQNLKMISKDLVLSNSGEGIIIKGEVTKGILLRGYSKEDFSKIRNCEK